MTRISSSAKTRASLLLAACVTLASAFAFPGHVVAQDNILVYGNSIIRGNTAGTNKADLWFADIVEQSGRPRPNVVTFIQNGAWTASYLANASLIQSSLPSGSSWKAMIVQGGTVEVTYLFNNDPLDFLANMESLASAFYAHSPQGLVVGHETGADHPDNASRYPSWFANPAEWLMFPQRSYAAAKQSIDAQHPSSPPMRIAKQGTCFAETTGYQRNLYTNDFHHLRVRGQLLSALLWYQEIYGGRLCDLVVDYSVSTPLVARLQQFNLDVDVWRRLASYADRIQPRGERVFPGSDSDLQLRTSIGAGALPNLCSVKDANVGATLNIELRSPLGANLLQPAVLLQQITPQHASPIPGNIAGLWLDRNVAQVIYSPSDLSAASITRNLPASLAGKSVWLQVLSYGPVGTPGFDYALSDAQRIDVH